MADLFGDLPALATPNNTEESQSSSETQKPSISISAPASFSPPTKTGEAPDHFVDLPDFKPPENKGIAANIGAGTNEAVTNFLGAPVDLTTAAINAGTRGVNYLLGSHIPRIEHPVGGSESIRKLESTYGGSPEDVTAVTPTEQVARSAARGAASMALPGGAAKAIPELAGAAGAVQNAAEAGIAPSGMVAGATGALTGDAAAAVAPEPYKGLAETVGNLVGGGAGAMTAGVAADAALSRGLQALSEESAPVAAAKAATGNNVASKDIVRAGQRISESSRNPEGLTIGSSETPAEGFQPTLGQSSGDLGVLALERDLRNRYRDLFIAHDAANNAALSKAIGNLAPEDASAAAGKFVRSHLDALNAADQAEQTQLTASAQQATEQLGGQPATATASDLGNAARERLEQVRAPLKNAASRALEAVDPEGNLALPTDTVASAASDLLGTGGSESPFAVNSRAGETAAGPERPVLQAASQLGDVSSFSDLRALLGQVSAAQRAIRTDPALGAESRPSARMRELRGAIEDAMVNGAERSAAANQVAKTAVEVPSKVDQWERWLTEGRNDWYGQQRDISETGSPRARAVGNAGEPSLAVPGSSRTAGQASERSGGVEGVSGVPAEAQPLTPNFDAEATDRLTTANRAYADYKQRFRQGPIGDVMASGNTPNGYRLGDAQVVSRLFRPGQQGGDAIDSLIRAAGSPEEAARVLGDYPAYSLRQAAEKNGILDPAAYQRWSDRFHDAMARLPDLQARFGDAARASQELADSTTRWRQARENFQDTALRHYLNVDPEVAPEQAIDRLMRSQNPVSEAQSLMREAWTHPDVVESAQRNAVDWVLGKIRTTAEAGTTGERELSKAALQRILEGKPAQAEALRIIMGPERFAVLQRVSDAMDLAARAQQATSIKGSPGTAADVHALGSRQQPSLLLQTWMGDKAGELLGHAIGAVGGIWGSALRAAGAVGGAMMSNARAQGIERIDQLVTQAVLHPELGRLLLGAAAQSVRDPRLLIAARQLAALGLTGNQRRQDKRQNGYARGGAITAADINREAKRADPKPSEAQKEAENYRKAHIILHGLPITIENAKGSWRRGVDSAGKPWKSVLPAIYGYIKRTEGMDGEHVDVYVGPHPKSDRVFVIDQIDADTGKPDEHKVMFGFKDFGQALDIYHRAFSDGRGPDRFGAVKVMNIAELKEWLKADAAKKPVAA